MQLIDFSASLWSVLPPILALSLAIITRKVLLSLSIGIIVGALMLADGSLSHGASYLFERITALFYSLEEDGFAINTDNVNILIFLLLLGILTAILSLSGSNQAFVEWAKKRIKTRRGAKLLAACLVFITFIDDYFHSLAVGAIARPITDKYQVSRAKLAYILDSTAAPMCVMMPVSSWGAYIITLVAGLLAEHAITGYTPIGAFMAMSAMNFYAIFSMILVFAVAYFTIDIGPMRRHEENALKNAGTDEEKVSNQLKGKVRNLVLPILVLILATVAMMMHTGGEALAADNLPFTVLGAFENTTVGISLVVGGVSSVLMATILTILNGGLTANLYTKAVLVGMKSMMGAILILIFAWTINKVVGDMQTGKYLSSLISGNLSPALLPAILFVLGAIMAFSTGTSWGTFGIMLPIASTIAVNAAPDLFLPCLSAVMAGAVCGDHCSPVSDTTILSSTGAKCNHMDHVTTQIPYVLIVATATILGYLVVGFTYSAILGFVTAAAVIALFVLLSQKRTKKLI